MNVFKSRQMVSNRLAVVLLLVVSYFACFHQLGAMEMQLWDESSYALNAQEMLERGTPFRMYLLNEPELYNTKPPFAVWCMALSIKVFGFNEVGARFPSALFAFCAAWVLFLVVRKITQNSWSALFAPLVLLSSLGFMGLHEARSGDTDAILAFWILSYCMAFFQYTSSEEDEHKNKWLFLTLVAFSFACFTKGIAGLTAAPALVLWALYSKKIKVILTNKYFYGGLAFFIILVPGYYILRNYLTPGYLDAVFNFEVGGRLWQQEYLNPEPRPFYYFYKAMVKEDRLLGWILVLPVSIVYIIKSAPSRLQRLGIYFTLCLLILSISLGLSSTKLFWYDAPMYPLIAGVIGISFVLLMQQLSAFTIIVFLYILSFPFTQMAKRNFYTEKESHFGEFLRKIRQDIARDDSIHIINADPNFVVHFYAKQDRLKGNYADVLHMDSVFTPGMMILTQKYAREVDMNNKFVLDTISTYYECSYYKIVREK